jgi:hypothetical protein
VGLGSSKLVQRQRRAGRVFAGIMGLLLSSFNAQVIIWTSEAQIWKLIPVKVEGAFAPSRSSSEVLGSGFPPSYDGDVTGQSTTRAEHTESERDGFGTIVTEVTTIKTRKRYRVEDA